MAKLGEARQFFWRLELWCRQQKVVEAYDPRRRGSGMHQTLRDIQRQQFDKAVEAGEGFRRAFAGLLEPVWIESYVRERLEPLQSLAET